MTIANSAAQETAEAARKSTGLAREEFISTHRPILRVRKVQVNKLEVGKKVVIQFDITNVGSTMATLVEVFSRVDIPEAIPHPIYPSATLNPSHGSYQDLRSDKLGSGQTICLAPEMSLVWDSGSPRYSIQLLTISGIIRYRDERRIERTTAFRRHYLPVVHTRPPHRFVLAEKPDPDHEYED